jgi:hypothetical protein
VAEVGLEPLSATASPVSDLRDKAARRAAKSGAVSDDPDLARVIDAWPGLPSDVRAAVLALVEGTG